MCVTTAESWKKFSIVRRVHGDFDEYERVPLNERCEGRRQKGLHGIDFTAATREPCDRIDGYLLRNITERTPFVFGSYGRLLTNV